MIEFGYWEWIPSVGLFWHANPHLKMTADEQYEWNKRVNPDFKTVKLFEEQHG